MRGQPRGFAIPALCIWLTGTGLRAPQPTRSPVPVSMQEEAAAAQSAPLQVMGICLSDYEHSAKPEERRRFLADLVISTSWSCAITVC